MKIVKNVNEDQLVLALEGRLDTNTAGSLEQEVTEIFESPNFTKLVFDFKALEYVSSAGLRVILATQKKSKQANVVFEIVNACDDIMEVFEITGFIDAVTIIK